MTEKDKTKDREVSGVHLLLLFLNDIKENPTYPLYATYTFVSGRIRAQRDWCVFEISGSSLYLLDAVYMQ
jgi:hypothetical protein